MGVHSLEAHCAILTILTKLPRQAFLGMTMGCPLLQQEVICSEPKVLKVFVQTLLRLLVIGSCQLYLRFDFYLRAFAPLGIVDMRNSERQRLTIANDFMYKSQCCLSPGFRKLQQRIRKSGKSPLEQPHSLVLQSVACGLTCSTADVEDRHVLGIACCVLTVALALVFGFWGGHFQQECRYRFKARTRNELKQNTSAATMPGTYFATGQLCCQSQRRII